MAADWQPGQRRFTILCVCTGNICRSPVAERLLVAALGDSVDVGSAGTGAMVGAPIATPMAEMLRVRGAVVEGFAARNIGPRLIKAADLVLTADLGHRAAVVELWPAAVRRTFTLKEFARLLAAVDPDLLKQASLGERLVGATDLAGRQRGYQMHTGQNEIGDPYGRNLAAYRTAFGEIAEVVDFIAAAVHH